MSSLITNIFELSERFKDIQPPKFLWRGIQEGNFGYIFGPPKCGKTTLCECLAISIASGAETFLGSPLIVKDPRVLIVSLEESDHYRYLRNKKQFASISVEKGQEWIKNIQFSTDEFPKSITSKDDWELLRIIIEESEASTVIIDSLSHMTSGPIEESTNAMRLSRKLREISRSLNITLIVVHHSTKQGKNEQDMSSMAGSRVVAQECDYIMGLDIDSKRLRLRDIGIRYAAAQEDDLYLHIDENQWVHADNERNRFSLGTVDDLRKSSTKKEIVWDTLNMVEMEFGEIKTEYLIPLLVETKKMSKPIMYNAIKYFIAKGKLKQIKKGFFTTFVEE